MIIIMDIVCWTIQYIIVTNFYIITHNQLVILEKQLYRDEQIQIK